MIFGKQLAGQRSFFYAIAAMSFGPELHPSKVLAGLYSAAAAQYAELWAPVLSRRRPRGDSEFLPLHLLLP